MLLTVSQSEGPPVRKGFLFVVGFAVIGICVLAVALANAAFISAEPESGTLSGSATVGSDSSASGGSYVQFGAGTACPAGQVSANDGSCVSLPSGTTKLVFDDEFSSTSADSTLWNVLDVHGDRSNSEPECYLPSQVSESGGVLTELLEYKSVTCPIDSSNGGTGTLSSNYDSGAIQMKSFNFEYGTIQARMKLAPAWPALWLLGKDCQLPNYLTTQTCNWPNPGSEEIDMAELMSDESTINEQVHSSLGNPGCKVSAASSPTANYHDYTMVWSPGKLTFQIDGVTTCSFTNGVPAENMFIILDTAVRSAGISSSLLPMSTSIDYLRVFQ